MSSDRAMKRRRLGAGPRTHGGSPGDIELAFFDEGQGPAVVLCHGFPEIAYSWRHQIGALAAAGYRVIAPDQRGYGQSDAPEAIDAYGMAELTGDLVALLDALEIERAVFVGHDWGGFVTWAMPTLYPARTAGVIGVNTPHRPMPTTASLRQRVAHDEDLYLLWFQVPGVAEAVLDAHARDVFVKLMRRPGEQALGFGGLRPLNPFIRIETLEPRGPALLEPGEIDAYVQAFEKSGFRGGINWYRNIDRNAERFPAVGRDTLEIPCLMVCAARDPALPPALAADMPTRVPDLELHTIEDCGHWTQQEQPEKLNALMIDWLRRRFPTTAT